MNLPPGEPEQREEIQIGGQAVLEGVVMRTTDRWALAVRRPRGDLFVTVNPSMTLAQKYPRWNVFPVRGVFALVDSLIIGIKAMSISGSVALEEAGPSEPGEPAREPESADGPEAGGDLAADEPRGVEPEPRGNPKQAVSTLQIAVAMLFALALFVGVFIVLPTLLASPISKHVHNTVVYNLAEGGIRVAIFVLYLLAMAMMPDVRRVFAYHGAEHKVVHAYEDGAPLTPQAASRYSTAHMRCGTAFVLIVFVISIFVFSFLGRPALWLRIVERVALIPFVAAFSYEIIRFAGRHETSRATRAIMWPGLLLQRLTTRQPDEDQLAVAIAALEAATRPDGCRGAAR